MPNTVYCRLKKFTQNNSQDSARNVHDGDLETGMRIKKTAGGVMGEISELLRPFECFMCILFYFHF